MDEAHLAHRKSRGRLSSTRGKGVRGQDLKLENCDKNAIKFSRRYESRFRAHSGIHLEHDELSVARFVVTQ